ncbi:hypothetical protein MIR68_000657 [Amoeboaphelidium protococcarum]|nr:hypothetical protein MIR68_000657 [Amoeboaphelidium protococcarum]
MTVKEPIRKILIANRGEIACRIVKTCRSLGISTVAVYSDTDASSLFVKQADEAVHIGPSQSSESYLRGQKIIQVALAVGAQAIHPGFGFLSENAQFAQDCISAGLIFIGPLSESINAIGDKISAKQLLQSKAPQVPLIPGYNGDDQSVDTLLKNAMAIGFPLLIKASAGGGGKGMRVVRQLQGESQQALSKRVQDEIQSARGEAMRSFGDDKVLLERYFDNVKHIEVQIIGDEYGNVYHLFERECSVQRRHQKLVEETPSPLLTDSLRARITGSAVEIGELIKYKGAGTVEFILDVQTSKFYFLEVNTRLQVEHPITESITGLDIVELQIYVANGGDLSKKRLDQVQIKGHAIEVRLCAEDPNNNFYPCTGDVLFWQQCPTNTKSGFPRYDSGVVSGSQISVYYDSMISKIISWGASRQDALNGLRYALQNTVCLGLTTNKSFLLQALDVSVFKDGSYTTRMIEDMQLQGVQLGFRYDSLREVVLPNVKTLSLQDYPTLDLLNQSPHQTASYATSGDYPVKCDLTLIQEITLASCAQTIMSQQLSRKSWNCAPLGWRLVRWRPFRETFDLQIDLPDKQLISIEYVSLDDLYRPVNMSCLNFAMRFVKVVNGGTLQSRVDKVVKYGPWISVSMQDMCQISDHIGKAVSYKFTLQIADYKQEYICARPSNSVDQAFSTSHQQTMYLHNQKWPRQFAVKRVDPRRSAAAESQDALSAYTASMPCRILKVIVQDGSKVKIGDALLTMESMKMEIKILAKHNGTVKFNVTEGQVVEANTIMLEIK